MRDEAINPSDGPFVSHLAWVSLCPLDAPVEYIVCSYPHLGETRVVQADTGLEVGFHLDTSARRHEGATMDDSDRVDALMKPGNGPINFPARGSLYGHHGVFAGVFDTFSRYQDARYRARVEEYFAEFGAVDNDRSHDESRRHLADLVAFVRSR